MSAPTKNIVFDWNSTLFDDVGALLAAHNIVLGHFGYAPIDLPTYQDYYEVPFEKLLLNHGLPENEVERIIEASKEIFHDHYEPRASAVGLREGSDAILRHAEQNGVRIYILSNHLVEPIRAQLRRLEIEQLFLEVLAYPSREMQFKDMTKGERLRRFMAQNGMDAAQTIIVGDSVEEIHIAKDLGLISVAITGGCASEERLRAEKPDYLIHSLHELKPILRERGFVS